MNWRAAVSTALAVTAGVFLLSMGYVVVRALIGTTPVATVELPRQATGAPQFGAPAVAIPRGGVRTLLITSTNPRAPLAIKARSATRVDITLSVESRGVLRAAQPEVAPFGREVSIPIGRLPRGTTAVRVYAKTVPAADGPPIVLEEVRLAWNARVTLLTTIIVWAAIVSGPLFLMLLITRFAIGPSPDRSGD